MSAAVPPPGDARGANHLGNGFQQTGFVEPVAHLKENGVAAQSSPQSSPLVNKPAPVTPRSNGLSNSVPSLVSGTTAQSDDLTPATPTAAGPPTVLKPKDAEKVPVVAREAVVEADKRAAPQPQLDEKKDAELRQVKGEEAEGTIVEGIEDDALWVMLRSFNNASRPSAMLTNSKSTMCFTPRRTRQPTSPTCARPTSPMCPTGRTR